ncbi:MAG: TetR/AcrR family transcriptional regulator [Pseudomonadota bacterium]
MASNRSNTRSSPFNRKAQHDAKRMAILSEAARLFNGKGSRATTLQDVAKGLGLTKTSLYYYVRTKEDLIFQCYDLALQKQHECLDYLEAQSTSPLEKAREFFRHQFASWINARDGRDVHIAALLEIASLKAERRAIIEREYVRMFKRLRSFLRDAQASGQAREFEPTSTTRALIGATDWLFYWLPQMDVDSVNTAADTCWDILLNGVNGEARAYEAPPIPAGAPADRPSQGFDREEQNKLKQEAFYKAGTWFFNKAGFNGASLDDIAEHLNVSKGAFYYHIRNKEDLLYACYERSISIMEGIHGRVMATDVSGLEKFDETARRVFHAQNSDVGPLIRYNTITALPKERRLNILAATEKNNSLFDTFILEGVDDGSIRAVDPFLARSLMAGAINASMDIGLWRRVDDIDAAAIDYFDIFFNGLLPRTKAEKRVGGKA